MIRKAFVMQVNPDAHEEYQRRHNPIWPELEAVLKSHGAHNYAIYLERLNLKSGGMRLPVQMFANVGGNI